MRNNLEFTRSEIAEYYANRLPTLKQDGEEWRGACPIHNGTDANFTVKADTGEWYCHSQCKRGGSLIALEAMLGGDDLAAAAARVARLIGRSSKAVDRKKIVAVYDYTDEHGNLVHQTVRYEPKAFSQRKPDGHGGWTYKLDGIQTMLYRLPAIISAAQVIIVEGEKDVDSLQAIGFVATCNPMGAGKWRDRYSDFLTGKDVVIFPDNDETGKNHAEEVARSLRGKAGTVRVATVGAGKDVSDWIANGAARQDIEAAVESSHVYEPIIEPTHGKGSLPRGFRKSEDGIFYRDPNDEAKGETFIISPIEVVAVARNNNGEEWTKVIDVLDTEGRVHRLAVPMSMFAGLTTEVRAMLMHAGAEISTTLGGRQLLDRLIQSWKPPKRMRCVSNVGWHESVFVFPDGTLGPDGAEDVIYGNSNVEHQYKTSGTLQSWQTEIGIQCAGNSRLVLAVSAAFAPTLLSALGMEPGGLHFRGLTSIGKTTALFVAGSVWGGGGSGFVRSWRTTDNGLESVAALHNDALLILDEMAQAEPRDVGRIAYLLANGQGKTRMNKLTTTRRQYVFRLMFLSSGEVKMSEYLATAGIRVKGGQEVRLLDIEADAGKGYGMFEDIHAHERPGDFADALKASSRRHYGFPAREFIKWLIATPDAFTQAEQFVDSFLKKRIPERASSEVRRAGSRFALIAAAGELATEAGITGWTKGEAEEASVRCFTDWTSQRGTLGSIDVHEGVKRVREFLAVNGSSRFQNTKPRRDSELHPIPERIYNRAGFREEQANGTSVYYIFRDVFQDEICVGYDYHNVLKALRDRGLLLHDEDGHLTTKPLLPELGRVRVYAVYSKILEGG